MRHAFAAVWLLGISTLASAAQAPDVHGRFNWASRAIQFDVSPPLRDIPVIMMSGNEQAMEQFFGTRIGADDFMKKPFSRYEIFFRIERLLDDHLVPRRAATQAHPRIADLTHNA